MMPDETPPFRLSVRRYFSRAFEALLLLAYSAHTRMISVPGAMLTHGNYTATVSSVCTHMNQEPWKSRYRFGPEDVSISYLPLAHTFEQVVANTLLAHGG